MVRDRQHGPVIELNRISAARARQHHQQHQQQPQQQQMQEREAAAPSNQQQPSQASSSSRRSTVFEQMVSKCHLLGPESLLLPHRVWKVKFVGELHV